MRISLSWLGLGLGLGCLAAACTPNNPQSETSSESDTEACQPGSLNCVCEANGCDPGLVCASGFCVEDAATSTDITFTSTSSGPVTTGSETGTTGPTGDSMTTEAPECDDGPGVSQQCPATTPYCLVEGTCAGCSALASCAEVVPGAPVCDGDSGLCVECTDADASACGGATPVCDAATKTCTKCVAHEQCPSGACDIVSGECFEDALWVDRQASCDGDGTQESPFCEIQDAVATVGPDAPTLVRVLPGVGAYEKKIDVGSGRIVAIAGEGGAPQVDVDLDAVLVNDDARVYLRALRFVGSSMTAGKGIVCLNAEVWTESVEFSSREAVAIDANDCTLRVQRSRVYLNPGGAVRLNGGSLALENSFVTSNGGNFSQYGGIHVMSGAQLDAVYATIIGNNSDNAADSIHCTAPGEVSLRNVVLFGQAPATSVICDGVTASDSIVDSAMFEGARNVVVEPAPQSAWFKDAANGDFHVKAGAPFDALARWRAGDPAVDYDGDARPDTELAADWAGADRLP